MGKQDEMHETTGSAGGASQAGLAKPSGPEALRRSAERLVHTDLSQGTETLSPEACTLMLHELRVHQVELEIQNEELRRVEGELQATLSRYFDLYNLAPVGYLTLSAQGLVLEANLTAADLFGVARGGLVSQPLTRWIFPADQDLYARHRKELVEGGPRQNWDMRMLRADGTSWWANIQAHLAGDGECKLTLGDITERKQAEENLRKSEEFVRNILESVDEGLVVIDPEFKIVTANRAYCQLVKAPLDEVAGRHCFAVFPQREQPCFLAGEKCAVSHTFKTGQSGEATHIFNGQEGQSIYVEAKAFPLKDGSGQVIAVIETLNDVTEKKKLEGQLRQAQKMEAIGTLAGGIAHDFNNILTAIIGYGEIVLEQMPPDSLLREEQGHVLNAGKRAAELVKQILTFSRRSERQLQPLLIQFVVKEALKMLRSSIPTSIEMREDVDASLGPVLADPTQIHQVIVNLCTNAYQAMRETGGVLAISLKRMEVAAEQAKLLGDLAPGAYALLEVADTGCGMSQAVQERIFEPYYTIKATGEGTGLGLSLVHGIVTGLGGVVKVHSEPGQGATFKIYLPLLQDGQSGDRPVEPIEALPSGVEAIMVVDDEAAVGTLERKVLEGLGYQVTGFSDSEAALQAFRANPAGFDLILTDMTMPRMNGDELAKEILHLRPEMPIVLCTGFSELIDVEKAKELGIGEFLEKPLAKGELANAVRRALDGKSRVMASAFPSGN